MKKYILTTSRSLFTYWFHERWWNNNCTMSSAIFQRNVFFRSRATQTVWHRRKPKSGLNCGRGKRMEELSQRVAWIFDSWLVLMVERIIPWLIVCRHTSLRPNGLGLACPPSPPPHHKLILANKVFCRLSTSFYPLSFCTFMPYSYPSMKSFRRFWSRSFFFFKIHVFSFLIVRLEDICGNESCGLCHTIFNLGYFDKRTHLVPNLMS